MDEQTIQAMEVVTAAADASRLPSGTQITGLGRTRTFTDDELSVLITALIAVRPHLTKDEQDVVNDIMRDGWS